MNGIVEVADALKQSYRQPRGAFAAGCPKLRQILLLCAALHTFHR
jgi:hypothetical protein